VAVVLIGTNNLTAGRSPEETSRGIAAVVAAIREESSRTRVLLLGLLPRHASLNDPMRERVDRVNALIERLDDGDSVQVLDVGHEFLRADGRIRAETMPDFLHPCAEGYRICAAALREPLRDMLVRTGPVGRSIARVRPVRRFGVPRA
jgi:lysophospholipase L1-like esterase